MYIASLLISCPKPTFLFDVVGLTKPERWRETNGPGRKYIRLPKRIFSGTNIFRILSG